MPIPAAARDRLQHFSRERQLCLHRSAIDAVGHAGGENDRRAVEADDAEFEVAVGAERAARAHAQRLAGRRDRNDQTVADADVAFRILDRLPSWSFEIVNARVEIGFAGDSTQFRHVGPNESAGFELRLHFTVGDGEVAIDAVLAFADLRRRACEFDTVSAAARRTPSTRPAPATARPCVRARLSPRYRTTPSDPRRRRPTRTAVPSARCVRRTSSRCVAVRHAGQRSERHVHCRVPSASAPRVRPDSPLRSRRAARPAADSLRRVVPAALPGRS